MNRNQPIKIKSVDVASVLQKVTGEEPELMYESGSTVATFLFKHSDKIMNTLAMYEIGLQVDAKDLLAIRNQLFRRLKGGR
jgi:hypothetical protein